jgi:hypothetical protein
MNMLPQEEANRLCERLEDLRCVDPGAADGLFTYVLKGESKDERSQYERHLSRCEYCRVALKIYRYQREVIHLLGRGENEGKAE